MVDDRRFETIDGVTCRALLSSKLTTMFVGMTVGARSESEWPVAIELLSSVICFSRVTLLAVHLLVTPCQGEAAIGV